MFTSLMLVLSLRLAFDIRRFVKRKLEDIERDEDGNIKISDPKAKWWKRILQKALAILNQIIRAKQKELLVKKKIRKKTIKKREKESIKSKAISKDSISYIAQLLTKFEEFVKQDLTIMIKEMNSFLHSLRQEIANHVDHDIYKVNTDLQAIKKLYHDSETMLDKFTNQCYGYQKTILTPQKSTPQHKLIQSRLTKVMQQLEKGHKMTDLTKNKDFTYLDRYLKEKAPQEYSKTI
ncbi:MAG: hypothetical protein N4A31_04505 [Rickettsiales bacterium]|jgi:hypothetical protein|nr:hypothetical protein [Rickettsiales bacterium]